ncbi:ATP-grasp domain-containing protein [Streptomyces albidoflavus]|uniref:ATP-grasp domain-containing protein n=1 Tax=Streptomyces albidoflavus TaxID=1886 RepID=UPI0033CF4F87
MSRKQQHTGAPAGPDFEDRTALASAVAGFFRDRKLIVVSSRLSVNTWLLDFLRGHGLPMPFMVLTDTTGVPADIPNRRIEVEGTSVDSWLRALEEQLLAPSVDLLAALDIHDPDRTALVLTPPLTEGVHTVLGRRCFGWRRPEWARYEDKTVSSSLWERAGVPAVPSMVTEPTVEALASAFDACERGAGVVVSADASAGIHSGSRGVVRVRDRACLDEALAFLHGRSRRAVVTPFMEGISCSLHGMVFEKEVAVFRPIEQVVLRDAGTRFPLLGGNAMWNASEQDTAEIREIARRVGERLRDEVGYRGSFGLDAILTVDGFRPIEVNARMGGFIVNGGPAAGVPLDLIHAMVIEGEEVGISPAALERAVIGGFATVPGTSLTFPLAQDAPEEARVLFLCWEEGNGFRPAGDGAPHDAVVRHVQTPVGSRLALEFPSRPGYMGVPLGPFAIAAIDAAARVWGLPVRDLGYASVVR